MTRHASLVAILTLALTGGAVALAQDGTTQTIDGEVTELVSVASVPYGEFVYDIDVRDGTVAQGFVTERAITTDGSTLTVVLVVHDDAGWRVAGTLTGEASGPLAQATAGSVLTLSVIGSGDE